MKFSTQDLRKFLFFRFPLGPSGMSRSQSNDFLNTYNLYYSSFLSFSTNRCTFRILSEYNFVKLVLSCVLYRSLLFIVENVCSYLSTLLKCFWSLVSKQRRRGVEWDLRITKGGSALGSSAHILAFGELRSVNGIESVLCIGYGFVHDSCLKWKSLYAVIVDFVLRIILAFLLRSPFLGFTKCCLYCCFFALLIVSKSSVLLFDSRLR